MAEAGDKTEAPTPRRRADAAERGQVARSTDLNSSVMMLGAVLLLGVSGESMFGGLATVLERNLSAELLSDVRPDQLFNQIVIDLISFASILAPLSVGLCVIAIAVNVFQTGIRLSPARLKPNLKALNPLSGLQRLFSGGRGFVHALIGVVKLVLVSCVAYSAIHDQMGEIILIAGLSHERAFVAGMSMIYDVALRVSVALVILAILDLAYQRWKHEQDLRMTKQEVKDEMKKMDGDPLVKSRRRQIQTQRALQRLGRSVPTADVVVTNPTHVAVALKFESDKAPAPVVVAKGADLLALKIRQLAIENGVPIIQRPPLARAMYKSCEVGQMIPEQFYATVAEILAYVWELTGRTRAKAREYASAR
jgi:flagellar biosynthetic protein FlhB